MTKKDCFYPNTALLLAIGFWIPLLNVGLATTSLILAVRGLRQHDRAPAHFGGQKRAIAAIILSTGAIILTAIGIALYTITKYKGCFIPA